MRGFDSQDDDTTEQHDEAVFIRLGTRDKEELRGGFPKDAETLFEYDAIVIDDLEASFFTEDQKSLLQQFVSLRGGGLLMLGGQESFVGGDYAKTQIGEMLPVYLDRLTPPSDKIPKDPETLCLCCYESPAKDRHKQIRPNKDVDELSYLGPRGPERHEFHDRR